MQEILSMIYNLIQKRKLVEVDLFIGGIGNEISFIYDLNRFSTNRIDKNFEIKSIPTKNYNEITDINYFFKQQSIVIASSGMMIKGTSSYQFALKWLARKKSAIFTVGYMDPSTPGFVISKAKKNETIEFDSNEKIEVHCEIKNFRFPSHSNRNQLLQIVKKLKPEKVILIHGEEDSIYWLANSILKYDKKIKIILPQKGKEEII